MIDLDKLEAEREAATIDKCDLFDFYHENWANLVAEVRRLTPKPKQYSHGEAMAKVMPRDRAKPWHPEYDPE